MGSATHLGLKCNDFQNHLHGEHPSEDHVQNVHGVVEHLGLLVVLWTKTGTCSHAHATLRKEAPSPVLPSGIRPLLGHGGSLPSPASSANGSPGNVRARGSSPTKCMGLDGMSVTG